MILTAKRIEGLAHELATRSDQAVREAIKQYDVDTRLALKLAIDLQRDARGMQAQADDPPGRHLGEQNGAYWLRRLNVHGPITQKSLEAKMTKAGLDTGIRIEVKLMAIEHGWLSQGLGYRMSAAGELATDQNGRPLGRMATDSAAIDHRSEPVSVEMRSLYRRAGLQTDQTYSQQEINEALAQSDLPTVHTMALRQELHMRRQVRASSQDTLADRLTTLRALQRRLQRP
jgi:hypothetical protein